MSNTSTSQHTTSSSSAASQHTMSDISSVPLSEYFDKENRDAEEDARERAELVNRILHLTSDDETMPSRAPFALYDPAKSNNDSDDVSSVVSSYFGADTTDTDDGYYTCLTS
ncbi:hypothetical protein TKK_0009439 [Trichogramma kaykai]